MHFDAKYFSLKSGNNSENEIRIASPLIRSRTKPLFWVKISNHACKSLKNSFFSWFFRAAAVFFFFFFPIIHAGAIETIPEALRPWTEWVLRDNRASTCSFLHGEDTRICARSGVLTLIIEEESGRFLQRWEVQSDTSVLLPGDERMVPLDVLSGRNISPVIIRDGRPMTFLSEGEHVLSGRFEWKSIPESIAVPVEIAIVNLVVSGRKIQNPERDNEGRVWISRRSVSDISDTRLEVSVNRRIDDDVPVKLTTSVELRVSGESREEIIGKALPDGFYPYSVEGPLPSTIDSEGNLVTRVRPGTYVITIMAASRIPVEEIILPSVSNHWPEQEIWVFASNPSVRIVDIGGVPAVDPDQTRLPDEWRRLPAYRIIAGETMILREQHRGAPESRDRLRLRKDLRLDFDGGGFVFRDNMSGELNEGWRLEIADGIDLGRVTERNNDLLITVLEDGNPGIELRNRKFSLSAEGRFNRNGNSIRAVGWDRGVDDLNITLHLPPGWSLLEARGVDDAPGTWINSWSLLDIFLLLVLTLGIMHLFGWRWGLVAFLTLLFILPESDAPRWIWAVVVILEALRRALPTGKFCTAVNFVFGFSVIILAIISVPFISGQVQKGIDPIMERPGYSIDGRYHPGVLDNLKMDLSGFTLGGTSADSLAGYPVQMESMPFEQEEYSLDRGRRTSVSVKESVKESFLRIDPKAVTQTGFGVPEWQWNTTNLSWHGPVHQDQAFSLYLAPPGLNRFFSFTRSLLTLLLFICLAHISRGRKDKSSESEGPDRSAASESIKTSSALILALFLFLPSEARAETGIPSESMLNDLLSYIVKPHPCRPECASMPKLHISIKEDKLILDMSFDIVAPSLVPLAGTGRNLSPVRVMVDRRETENLFRKNDGSVWLHLEEGRYEVQTESFLPGSASVQLPLPLFPAGINHDMEGWTLAGTGSGMRNQGFIELVRLARRDEEEDGFKEDSLQPEIRVERIITLGLRWEVSTRVLRISPTGTAVSLDIPLLEGESVTSEDITASAGHLRIALEPEQTQFSWRSDLEPSSRLELTAPSNYRWTETWQFNVSPIWHVETEGIPITGTGGGDDSIFFFKPWPDEKVSVNITRPKPAAGEVLTIDRSRLTLRPGRRVTNAELTVDIRTSQGGRHEITPPPHARLDSIWVDGRDYPVRMENGSAIISLVPGRQSIVMNWQEERPLEWKFSPEIINIGANSVNADIRIMPGSGRWILWTSGPVAGPSVYFWPVLLVVVLIAFVFSRVRYSPLRFHEWVLLGVGLTQVPFILSLVVAGWILALGYRREKPELKPFWFNIRQIILALWTLFALGILAGAIAEGLLGSPEMHIQGNGSSSSSLNWYMDRTDGFMPPVSVFSVPVFAYHIAMLLWALWLAFAMLRWLKWGWTSFREGGLWRKVISANRGMSNPYPQYAYNTPYPGQQPNPQGYYQAPHGGPHTGHSVPGHNTQSGYGAEGRQVKDKPDHGSSGTAATGGGMNEGVPPEERRADYPDMQKDEEKSSEQKREIYSDMKKSDEKPTAQERAGSQEETKNSSGPDETDK